MTQALLRGRLTEKARIRFLRRIGPDAPGVLALSRADVDASRGGGRDPGWDASFLELLDSLFRLCFERGAVTSGVRPLVSGTDLMEVLRLQPGPRVGQLLRRLEEARIQGTIGDRAGALRLAAAIVRGTHAEDVNPRAVEPDSGTDKG